MTGHSGRGITVGIVTALPLESAAVRLTLDQPEPVARPGDPNLYYVGTLPARGRGGLHRVVVASQTVDGTRAAAAICSDLARSFTDVGQIVLCGVAGGVPRDYAGHPVRLGDVVSATHGVIDYDHVYSESGGTRLRRAVEGQSKALLAADRELQTQEMLGASHWADVLQDRWPSGETFARPDPSSDPYGSGVLVPRVHRAAIGSADRLLKDAVLRDQLADAYDLVAVEMEGSGVAVGADMHGLRWYVVRGICDYADARKNERWQPYAALAAAAYTRALLGQLPSPSPVARQQAGQDGGALGLMVDTLAALPVLQDESGRQAVLALLPAAIRGQVPTHAVPRLQLIALVQTARRFPDGLDALSRALTLAMGETAPELAPAVTVLQRNWAHHLCGPSAGFASPADGECDDIGGGGAWGRRNRVCGE